MEQTITVNLHDLGLAVAEWMGPDWIANLRRVAAFMQAAEKF